MSETAIGHDRSGLLYKQSSIHLPGFSERPLAAVSAAAVQRKRVVLPKSRKNAESCRSARFMCQQTE